MRHSLLGSLFSELGWKLVAHHDMDCILKGVNGTRVEAGLAASLEFLVQAAQVPGEQRIFLESVLRKPCSHQLLRRMFSALRAATFQYYTCFLAVTCMLYRFHE